jgi:glycosyltransferase involved in cell wall biosynthesis
VPQRSPLIVRTAFVSTYPPRRCGIATFTSDLSAAIGNREIVALHPPEQVLPYEIEVHHRIRRDERADYGRTASALDGCVDVVAIQHEFGIWGGVDGSYVLDFVAALRLPAVTTLHTVLREPTAGQRAVVAELVARSDATVVMSQSAATLLAAQYQVDPKRLDVIPHGVPDLPLVGPETLKAGLGVDGRDIILSFGLLGPDKGLELALDALPAVVAAHPAVCYVIVGATHPDLGRAEGEAYRARLVAQVERLGLQGHVRFEDRFVGRVELARWLEAADVIVAPYAKLDRTASATLSVATAAGRAIVSTPFAYAAELLADGRGRLVPAGSAGALAAALNDLLGDSELRAELGRRAYAHSRGMVWSAVGTTYRGLLERVTTRAPLPRLVGSPAAVVAA